MQKCHLLALGVAIGATWSLGIGALAIMAMFGWGALVIEPIASVYVGYDASIIGAVIGVAWAFVDGFVAGLVIAWIYNAVASRVAQQ